MPFNAMNLPPLVLASASPRRRDLLRQMGYSFQVVTSAIPEVQQPHLSPYEICQLNAYRKARAVAKQHPDSLVIGADTLVCLEGRRFGKPGTLAEAGAMLAQLQGRSHQVVTGLCLIHLRLHRQRTFAESTEVCFRPLNEGQIRDYLAVIHPLDKAGAYAIQDHGEWVVERIEGSFSNVVGLPVERLERELRQWS
jgi:septum formation protein